jgi:hypothetical protein
MNITLRNIIEELGRPGYRKVQRLLLRHIRTEPLLLPMELGTVF